MTDYHDNYRLDPSPIDDGGQADVFRAQNRITGEWVALKRRKGGLSEAKDRMRREIEVQGSIEHPNVMPILDFDHDDHQWYTMPLAANTVDKLPTPIDSSLLATILRGAAEGLKAAHEKEFVHRAGGADKSATGAIASLLRGSLTGSYTERPQPRTHFTKSASLRRRSVGSLATLCRSQPR